MKSKLKKIQNTNPKHLVWNFLIFEHLDLFRISDFEFGPFFMRSLASRRRYSGHALRESRCFRCWLSEISFLPLDGGDERGGAFPRQETVSQSRKMHNRHSEQSEESNPSCHLPKRDPSAIASGMTLRHSLSRERRFLRTRSTKRQKRK